MPYMPYWKCQRVLLTGGSGFLGRNMREALSKLDCEVVAPSHSNYDLTYRVDVDRMLAYYSPTVVVHMAGLVGGIGANTSKPADFFYQNVLMGAHVLEYASTLKCVQKVIAVGAGCGYPEDASVPTKETDLWGGYPQKWSAAYSLAKRMLVVQAEAIYKQRGVPVVVGMPGNLYGPEDNFHLGEGHVIPALVRKFVEAKMFGHKEVVIWGTGKATRDFVYVEDVCEGLIRIAEVCDTPELVNLSSGREHTIGWVAATLADITGFWGKTVFDDAMPDGQMRRCFDVGKARSMGWEARTSLDDGLKRTVRWFEENYMRARK
jgi:GDP-L-fucose synthase